jgi:hypothetical protein
VAVPFTLEFAALVAVICTVAPLEIVLGAV